MKIFGLILTLAVLTACGATNNPRPEPAPETGGSGISISGDVRVGVSRTF